MTKKELYKHCIAAGLSLAPVENYSFRQLTDLLAPYGKSKTEEPPERPPEKIHPEKIPVLTFRDSFWCPELQRSFTRGSYKPSGAAELAVLRKYGE